MKENDVLRLEVNHKGIELRGTCSYGKEGMVVGLNFPHIVIAAICFYPLIHASMRLKNKPKACS